jgi:hypothetical protein
MALPVWLGGILSGGFSIVKEWVSSWQQRKVMQAQHKVKMAEIKIVGKENRALMDKEHEIGWDNRMATGSMTSWKDEWFTIILSIPLIGAFIPKLAPYILSGFEVLAECPDWYKGALGVAIGAAFGMRQYANWTMNRLSKQAMIKNLGVGGPAPEKKHKTLKLTRRSVMDAIKREAKEIAEDVKEEFSTDVEIPPTDADDK